MKIKTARGSTTAVIGLAMAFAVTGCKKDKPAAEAQTPPPAQAAASPAVPATAANPAPGAAHGAFDVALPVPAATPSFDVPGARGEPPAEPLTVASYKET